MSLTGLAVYPAYQGNPRLGGLGMSMGNHEYAKEFRALNPDGYLILRADDGNDEGQFNDVGTDPVAEARRFADRFIIPALARVPVGTYNAILGPCETWHHDKVYWRSRFERALCDIVQDELDYDYIAGSIPVGNLNANEVMGFADVFLKARWISYHAYLGFDVEHDEAGNEIGPRIHRSRLDQETDQWCLWRPTRIWHPILKEAGIKLRLLFTECGTGPRPADVGLDKDALARLDLQIAVALRAECEVLGIEYGGCLPFAFGAEGAMGENWNLDGYEDYFVFRDYIPEEDTMPDPRIQQLLEQNALITNGFKQILQGKFTGADGLAGTVVALQGGADLGFEVTFPPA